MTSPGALVPISIPGALAPRTNAKLVDSFLAGKKPSTLRAYAADLKNFATWAGVEDMNQAAAYLLGSGPGGANSIALDYKAHLMEIGKSANTINRRLTALRSLVKLARVTGQIPWQLEVGGLETEPYRDTRGPGKEVIRDMIRAAEKIKTPKGRRDLALIRLLFDCGLRRGEVVGLDCGHIDFDYSDDNGPRPTAWILGKKRNTREAVTLPAPTAQTLADWLKAHPDPAKDAPLFVNFDRARKGRRLTGSGIWQLIRTKSTLAGKTTRPHGLRHSAITEALNLTGGDLRKVARFSRHKDINVLRHYDDNREDLAGEVARQVAESL